MQDHFQISSLKKDSYALVKSESWVILLAWQKVGSVHGAMMYFQNAFDPLVQSKLRSQNKPRGKERSEVSKIPSTLLSSDQLFWFFYFECLRLYTWTFLFPNSWPTTFQTFDISVFFASHTQARERHFRSSVYWLHSLTPCFHSHSIAPATILFVWKLQLPPHSLASIWLSPKLILGKKVSK